ncbi:MAG: hypothetical protein JWM91_2040 [Rhodospirillales bacterium]|nr:hypothetical protein [Rhodospirillales bacterium]
MTVCFRDQGGTALKGGLSAGACQPVFRERVSIGRHRSFTIAASKTSTRSIPHAFHSPGPQVKTEKGFMPLKPWMGVTAKIKTGKRRVKNSTGRFEISQYLAERPPDIKVNGKYSNWNFTFISMLLEYDHLCASAAYRATLPKTSQIQNT